MHTFSNLVCLIKIQGRAQTLSESEEAEVETTRNDMKKRKWNKQETTWNRCFFGHLKVVSTFSASNLQPTNPYSFSHFQSQKVHFWPGTWTGFVVCLVRLLFESKSSVDLKCSQVQLLFWSIQKKSKKSKLTPPHLTKPAHKRGVTIFSKSWRDGQIERKIQERRN